MNFPLIAYIIVFAILLLLLAQTRHKRTGWSCHGRGFWPCPAHHLRL